MCVIGVVLFLTGLLSFLAYLISDFLKLPFLDTLGYIVLGAIVILIIESLTKIGDKITRRMEE